MAYLIASAFRPCIGMEWELLLAAVENYEHLPQPHRGSYRGQWFCLWPLRCDAESQCDGGGGRPDKHSGAVNGRKRNGKRSLRALDSSTLQKLSHATQKVELPGCRTWGILCTTEVRFGWQWKWLRRRPTHGIRRRD